MGQPWLVQVRALTLEPQPLSSMEDATNPSLALAERTFYDVMTFEQAMFIGKYLTQYLGLKVSLYPGALTGISVSRH